MLNSVPPSWPSAAAPTILVVEDDHAIRYLLTQVLEGSGYVVIACEDGAHGLTAASAEIDRIDAVITDSRMPGMDGVELVARIRALRPAMPILVVSGNVEEGDPRGADTRMVCLSKPVSPELLRLELSRLLSRGGDAVPQPAVR